MREIINNYLIIRFVSQWSNEKEMKKGKTIFGFGYVFNGYLLFNFFLKKTYAFYQRKIMAKEKHIRSIQSMKSKQFK